MCIRDSPEMLRHNDRGQEAQDRSEAAKEGGKAAQSLFQRLPGGAVPPGLFSGGVSDHLHPRCV